MIRIIAKETDSLLSVVLNREITIDQVTLIRKLLDATDEVSVAELESLDALLTLAVEYREADGH